MESGIYRDLASNKDLIVFGGRIARSVNWGEDRKDVLLDFVVTGKKYEVGDNVSKATFKDNAPQVGLLFDDPQSIDILIEDLQFVKDILNGMPKEELDAKYSHIVKLNEPTGENEQ